MLSKNRLDNRILLLYTLPITTQQIRFAIVVQQLLLKRITSKIEVALVKNVEFEKK